jgi:hypothetical protein
MEAFLLPELERRRELLTHDTRFSDARVVSLRHAAVVHTIALGCHPVSMASPEDSYSIHVNVIGISGISLRGFAEWTQPFILGRLPGFRINEAKTPSVRLTAEEELEEFLAHLPTLLKGFERGLRRGRPPSAWRQRWNSCVYSRD